MQKGKDCIGKPCKSGDETDDKNKAGRWEGVLRALYEFVACAAREAERLGFMAMALIIDSSSASPHSAFKS